MDILLAEDNDDHAELVIRSIEDENPEYRVHHVTNGEEALNFILRKPPFSDSSKYPTPSLILLDLRMPKKDGLEVLEEIKSTKEVQSIPTVILTTSKAHQDIQRAYALNANSFLVKPAEFDQFHTMITRLVHYWLILNTRPI